MGRNRRGGRLWMVPSPSASPASLELRFEHDRSPETGAHIERLLAGAEGADGP